MTDELIICKRCGGDGCYRHESPEYTSYTCYGCGFSTNSFWNEKNEMFVEIQKTIPELYKDIVFKDDDENNWYPTTINHPKKGMVFVEGTSAEDWKWTAVSAVPIDKRLKWKFPPTQTHIMDMKSKKSFEQKDYIEALDFIGYFKK